MQHSVGFFIDDYGCNSLLIGCMCSCLVNTCLAEPAARGISSDFRRWHFVFHKQAFSEPTQDTSGATTGKDCLSVRDIHRHKGEAKAQYAT